MVVVRHAGERLRARPLLLGAAGAAATLVVLGVPTDVIDTPLFGRKVPVHGFEVVVLVALAVIGGLFAATYARPAAATSSTAGSAASPERPLERVGAASGVVGWFAIGCPLCNPIVVALLGTSGATGLFAHLQPLLGAAAVALGALALALRLRALRRGTCAIAPTTR